jgi:hypothetical protein
MDWARLKRDVAPVVSLIHLTNRDPFPRWTQRECSTVLPTRYYSLYSSAQQKCLALDTKVPRVLFGLDAEQGLPIFVPVQQVRRACPRLWPVAALAQRTGSMVKNSDSVHACDSDNYSNGTPLWHVSLLPR